MWKCERFEKIGNSGKSNNSQQNVWTLEMRKLLQFILKVRIFRKAHIAKQKRWTRGVIWSPWRSSMLPWGEGDSSFGTCGSCRMEPLPTLRETPDSGGILLWQGHQPQDWLPVVATFPRPEPLWLFSLGLFEGSGLHWITSNCIGTQSSIMWINWETMLSFRDVWLGNSRRGLECAWTSRAATLSTCSDVFMTHPHTAESNVLLIVCFKAFYLILIKTQLM